MLLDEGVCYDQCVLLAKLLALAILHSVLQGQTCLLIQCHFYHIILTRTFTKAHSVSGGGDRDLVSKWEGFQSYIVRVYRTKDVAAIWGQ